MSLHCNSFLNMSVVKGIGVFFLTLCLLTFAFFCQNTKDTNTALVNLCLNLLLFHLTDILKSLYQTHLQPPVCVIPTFTHLHNQINVWIFAQQFFCFSSKPVQLCQAYDGSSFSLDLCGCSLRQCCSSYL